MTTNTSSTAAAGSDISKRVTAAIESAEKGISPERLSRLREVVNRVTSLTERGLLVKKEYHAASQAELERLYIAKKV